MPKIHHHQIQISIMVLRPILHTVTASLLTQALHYRATIGVDPPGIIIKSIIWWKDGKRYPVKRKAYTGDDITDVINNAFKTGARFVFDVH